MSLALALALLNVQTLAASPNAFATDCSDETVQVFNFDESEIYDAFDEVSDLESFIAENDVTYSELEASNSPLIEDVTANAALPVASGNQELDPPLISGFLWGCIFNWVGVVVVYLTTEAGNRHRGKSLMGCIISTLLWGGGWIFSSSYYY